MKKTLSDKKPVERNVLVVNVTSSTFMRGGSLVIARTIRPLKRKSTMHMSDMFQDIEVDIISNLNDIADGLHTVESVCSLDEFGNVDEVEYYLCPYTEKKDD